MAAVNLGDQVSEVTSIPDELNPPQSLHQGNRSFRIDVSDRAGFALTVSTDIPMYHIVGVGDFANSLAAVLWSEAFRASWVRSQELDNDSYKSLLFRHRQDNRFHLTLSQPNPSATRPPTIHLLRILRVLTGVKWTRSRRRTGREIDDRPDDFAAACKGPPGN